MKGGFRAKTLTKFDVKVVEILKINMYLLWLHVKGDETMHLIFFWKNLQLGALKSLLCVRAYFENWVKLLLPSQKQNKKSLESKIGYDFGTHHLKLQINLCKGS